MNFRLVELADTGSGLEVSKMGRREGPGTNQGIVIDDEITVRVQSLTAGKTSLPEVVSLRRMVPPVDQLGSSFVGTDPYWTPRAPGFWLREMRGTQAQGVAIKFSFSAPADGKQSLSPFAAVTEPDPIEAAGPDSTMVGYLSQQAGLVFFQAGNHWVLPDSNGNRFRVGADPSGGLLFLCD